MSLAEGRPITSCKTSKGSRTSTSGDICLSADPLRMRAVADKEEVEVLGARARDREEERGL